VSNRSNDAAAITQLLINAVTVEVKLPKQPDVRFADYTSNWLPQNNIGLTFPGLQRHDRS
jgi:hypothetical protein